MSEYYLREIMYEMYHIADAVTKGEAKKAREARFKYDREVDAVKLELMNRRFEQKPE